jgi:hypothetical protein
MQPGVAGGWLRRFARQAGRHEAARQGHGPAIRAAEAGGVKRGASLCSSQSAAAY